MRASDPADPANRRRHPRVELDLLVQFRSDTFEEFLVEYATNISEGGMFVRTTTPRPHGTTLYFQFVLRDGRTLIEGLAKVVHVNPPESSDPGMGLELITIDEESRALMRAVIDARVRDSQAPAPILELPKKP